MKLTSSALSLPFLFAELPMGSQVPGAGQGLLSLQAPPVMNTIRIQDQEPAVTQWRQKWSSNHSHSWHEGSSISMGSFGCTRLSVTLLC